VGGAEGHVTKSVDPYHLHQAKKRKVSAGEARRRYGGTSLHTYRESKRMQAIVSNIV
jgi:hypothetical protein